MAAFFDKLRTDRKLDESLKLVSEIQDATLRGRLQMLLSINFAGVQVDNSTLLSLVGVPGMTVQSYAAATPIGASALKPSDEPEPLQKVTAFPASAAAAVSGSRMP
jgi:hypothetical protein